MKRRVRTGYRNDWQKDPKKVIPANSLMTADGKPLKMEVIKTIAVEKEDSAVEKG